MTDRPRALAVLIAVFLLGCIIGSGGSYLWFRNSLGPERRTVSGIPPGPPQGGRPRMQEMLRLTHEQEKEFGTIMAESRKQIDAVRAQDQPKIESIFSGQQPKIEAIVAETNRKVMAILNTDQQKKFQALWKEMSSRRRHPPHGGGRGMSPPPQ